MYTNRDVWVEGSEHDVHCPDGSFRSIRLVTASDSLGFSVHKTIIPPGSHKTWHYRNHQEACYCVSGLGYLIDNETGKRFKILPGTIYIQDNHAPHHFEAIDEVVLISIFNPPCIGTEMHGEDGAFPATEQAA